MNSGIIADRYAKAFFQWIDSRSTAEDVVAQLRVLDFQLKCVDGFRSAMSNDVTLSLEQRISLLEAAVKPSELHPDLLSLYRLLDANNRVYLFQLVCLDCLKEYMDSRKIVKVRLTTARPDENLVPFIGGLIERRFGMKPVIDEFSDPELIGGFVCETWNGRLDSSVRSQLDYLRDKLSKTNKRVV